MTFNEILVAILTKGFILFVVRIEAGIICRKYRRYLKEWEKLIGHADLIYKYKVL